jgi:predicted DNA-binding transcriptional regulator AlpA
VIDLAAARAARWPSRRTVRKEQVVAHFGVSLSTVDRWIAAGMPKHPLGRRGVRFVVAECEAWHADMFGR